MNESHEANFESIIRHTLEKITGQTDVDIHYYTVLIQVAEQRIRAEKAGISQTKVQAFKTIVEQGKVLGSELNTKDSSDS